MQYLLLTLAKSLNGTNCTMSLAATPLRDLNLYKKKKDNEGTMGTKRGLVVNVYRVGEFTMKEMNSKGVMEDKYE